MDDALRAKLTQIGGAAWTVRRQIEELPEDGAAISDIQRNLHLLATVVADLVTALEQS